MPYQVAALLAAALWALSSLIAAEPARRLGGPRFTRIRMLFVCAMLVPLTTATGGWSSLAADDLGLVAVSGIVGLLIGDIALFTAMAKIGPRRTSVLFTTNAPMAAVGGVLLFDEIFTRWSVLGATMIVVGVMLAVAYGTRPNDGHAFEVVEGTMGSGIFWATVGAVGQAVGALAAKPVLDAGADTLAVAATRALIATAAMWLVARPTDRWLQVPNRGELLRRDYVVVAISALLAMVLGMTLLLYALGEGDAGITTILSATTPVMMLPLLWIRTGQQPPPGAWIGASLTVAGTAFLV